MPDLLTLMRTCGCLHATFAQCMFGGEARKDTTFVYTPGMHAMLQSLEGQSCGHGPNAHKVAGGTRKGDEWESEHFAAFPPALNYFLAQAIARPTRPAARDPRPAWRRVPSASASAESAVAACRPAGRRHRGRRRRESGPGSPDRLGAHTPRVPLALP
eukprot:1828290-Prymnesium_polylepis.1